MRYGSDGHFSLRFMRESLSVILNSYFAKMWLLPALRGRKSIVCVFVMNLRYEVK